MSYKENPGIKQILCALLKTANFSVVNFYMIVMTNFYWLHRWGRGCSGRESLPRPGWPWSWRWTGWWGPGGLDPTLGYIEDPDSVRWILKRRTWSGRPEENEGKPDTCEDLEEKELIVIFKILSNKYCSMWFIVSVFTFLKGNTFVSIVRF